MIEDSGERNWCETDPIKASRKASASSRIFALRASVANLPVTTATIMNRTKSTRWTGLYTRKS